MAAAAVCALTKKLKRKTNAIVDEKEPGEEQKEPKKAKQSKATQKPIFYDTPTRINDKLREALLNHPNGRGLPIPEILNIIWSYALPTDVVILPGYVERPTALMRLGDGKSLIFLQYTMNCVRRYSDAHVSLVTSNWNDSVRCGDAKQTELRYPSAMCVDPLRPTNFYLGDWTSIRYYDADSGLTLLIAGSKSEGYADGSGSYARFRTVAGLRCSSTGRALYVSDCDNHRIRRVDLTTYAVTTIAGDGHSTHRDGTGTASSIQAPEQLIWDQTAKSDSVLLIVSEQLIRRFDAETGVLTTLSLKFDSIAPNARIDMDQLPNGDIIVSTYCGLYLIHMSTGRVERIPIFKSLTGLVVIAEEYCVVASDYNSSRLVCIPLSPDLFRAAPKRDL